MEEALLGGRSAHRAEASPLHSPDGGTGGDHRCFPQAYSTTPTTSCVSTSATSSPPTTSRQTTQDTPWPHGLRIHLQMLANRTGSIYSRSHPSNAGTKHLVQIKMEFDLRKLMYCNHSVSQVRIPAPPNSPNSALHVADIFSIVFGKQAPLDCIIFRFSR